MAYTKPMTCKLSVNINAIAYLRNRRHVPWPDVAELGRVALSAGAIGLTVHPRPDERHIRHADVPILRTLIRSEFSNREFNIEGYPDERFLHLVEENQPDQVTLVPDVPGQSTSDHGWNLAQASNLLPPLIQRLKKQGMRVALFVDPDPALPALAKNMGADRIEIFTGPYGGAADEATMHIEFAKLVATGRAASAAGIELNAGHDLTRENLPRLVAALPNLKEVSIGHAIIADAMMFGMEKTVHLFRQAIGD
jgi:pyridoxine 5-phosphate synthase